MEVIEKPSLVDVEEGRRRSGKTFSSWWPEAHRARSQRAHYREPDAHLNFDVINQSSNQCLRTESLHDSAISFCEARQRSDVNGLPSYLSSIGLAQDRDNLKLLVIVLDDISHSFSNQGFRYRRYEGDRTFFRIGFILSYCASKRDPVGCCWTTFAVRSLSVK